MKNNKLKGIRHGEVFLQPIDAMPKGKTAEYDLYVVGHSESGNHHVLESKTKFTVNEVDEAFKYIQLDNDAVLVHKKTVNRHKDLVVPAGTYKVIRKQEYDPFQQIMRNVWD